MQWGSLVDCLLLETEEFDSRYILQPETYTDSKGNVKKWSANANACKTVIADAKSAGKELVNADTLNNARLTVSAIRNHSQIKPICANWQTQVSLFAEFDGVEVKGRLDALTDDAIYDLKTTQDASEQGFLRSIDKFLYHVQAAVYTRLYHAITGKKLPFRFIAVENDTSLIAPIVAVYELEYNSRTVELGWNIFNKALRLVKKYDKSSLIGYSSDIKTIELPDWKLKETEELKNQAAVESVMAAFKKEGL
jgi:exodeoxyribonuclease VIII